MGFVSSQEGKPPRFSTAHFPQFSGLKACWSASASASLAACHTAERPPSPSRFLNDGQSEGEICKYLTNSDVEMVENPKTKYTLNSKLNCIQYHNDQRLGIFGLQINYFELNHFETSSHPYLIGFETKFFSEWLHTWHRNPPLKRPQQESRTLQFSFSCNELLQCTPRGLGPLVLQDKVSAYKPNHWPFNYTMHLLYKQVWHVSTMVNHEDNKRLGGGCQSWVGRDA